MSKELAAKLLFICIILLGFVSLKYLKVKKEYGKESRAKMYFYNENVKLKAELDSAYHIITNTKCGPFLTECDTICETNINL